MSEERLSEEIKRKRDEVKYKIKMANEAIIRDKDHFSNTIEALVESFPEEDPHYSLVHRAKACYLEEKKNYNSEFGFGEFFWQIRESEELENYPMDPDNSALYAILTQLQDSLD